MGQREKERRGKEKGIKERKRSEEARGVARTLDEYLTYRIHSKP